MKKSLKINGTLSLIFLLIIFCSCVLNAQQSNQYEVLIEKYSKQIGVDKNLVKSIIKVSSGYNPKAVSQSGAVGLMQLHPDVLKSMGVKNPTDPDENIRAGCNYLKTLLNQFGEMELAVAAFNTGPSQVKKYGKVPPFAETKKFLADVMNEYEVYSNSSADSNVFGRWIGIAKYLHYEMKPEIQGMKSIVGETQQFDLEISPLGSGVSIKSFGKSLGDPSLFKTELGKNSLHVEYQGPNPFGIPIPNSQTIHTMTFDLDIKVSSGSMKGELNLKTNTKVIFDSPDLKPYESSAEVSYTLQLNLKKN